MHCLIASGSRCSGQHGAALGGAGRSSSVGAIAGFAGFAVLGLFTAIAPVVPSARSSAIHHPAVIGVDRVRGLRVLDRSDSSL